MFILAGWGMVAIQYNRESAGLWLLANLANAEDKMRSRSRNSPLCKRHGELKVVMDIWWFLVLPIHLLTTVALCYHQHRQACPLCTAPLWRELLVYESRPCTDDFSLPQT